MAAYKNQRDRIEQLETFINRFRYQATKAKQVQSRIKELEKIERIEVPEEEATIHFTIPPAPSSGRTIMEVSGLTKHYPMPPIDGKPAGTKRVLDDLNFTIERGERIALVGANGAGKSTLIRLLSRQEEPTAGTVREGHNVVTDFFAQDQYKVLDPDAVMLEDIAGAATKVPVVELRSLLGCFMFSGDDVFKKLGVLSGGERNRYAMAKMLVSPSNFLLLDEPTNHLDLRAKDVLLDAIANFTGTVLFVSHDRYFIDGLATRVFEVEDRRLHIYPGNYEDYLWRKNGGPEKVAVSLGSANIGKNGARPNQPSHPAAASPTSQAVILSERSESKDPEGLGTTQAASTFPPQPPKPAVRRLNPIKLKQLEDRVAAIESELAEIETRIAAAEDHLGHFVSADDSQRTASELDQLRNRRTTLTSEWEGLATQLEEQSTAV
jgi:ATP-binding cassette subfamily F protein 3